MAIQDEELVEPAALSVEISERDGVIVVGVTGELDLSTAGLLREILVEQILDGTPAVHMDLSKLSFCDSSGISLLVSACKRVRTGGGSFSIVTEGAQVRRVLEIEGLIDFLQVDQTP